MKNFIIFNSEKEGSCALVSTLNQFKDVQIISDFIEPFDRHMFLNNRGALGRDITEEDFLKCLSIIYDSSLHHLEALSAVYSKYNRACKFRFSKLASRGFKMRLRKEWNAGLFSLLKKYDVTAFVLFRKNILRWSLSKYHGDGKGNRGHLQFSNISINEMPKIKVDWAVLKKIITKQEKRVAYREHFVQELRRAGVDAWPLYYEDFCNNRFYYFKQFLQQLDISIADKEILETITRDCCYKKVHPDDISTYVENYQEVIGKFEAYTARANAWETGLLPRVPKMVYRALFSS